MTSHALATHLLRQLPAGVATLEGPELRYGFVNERLRAMLGEGAEGQRVADHPGYLLPAFVEMLPQMYAAGRPYVAKACACAPPAGQDGKAAASTCRWSLTATTPAR